MSVSTDAPQQTILVLGAGRKQDMAHYGLKCADGSTPSPEAVRFLTLDADAYVAPSIVCTLGRDRIPLDDNSVDFVIAMHVLEHIGKQGETAEWFQFWEEVYRVMKPGARLQFECPLYSSTWAWADPTHVRAISPETFVYFCQDSYRLKGSAIPTYRIKCDFSPIRLELTPDTTNENIRATEQFSMINGTLVAHKPLRPWWED